MRNAKFYLGSVGLAFLVGCGDYSGGQQTSASRSGSQEATHYGSATDISKNGEMPTNAANAADIGLGGPAQRESGNYQNQPVSSQMADEELARKIKVALTTGSIGTTGSIAEDQLTKIKVDVKDGNVTLSGPVGSEGERASIEKRVAGFNGVKSVNNNLSIQAAISQERPLDSFVPRGAGNNE